MKKTYFLFKSKLLFICIAVACIFIIHSCKKDQKSQEVSEVRVSEAQAWYEATYPQSLITTNANGQIKTQSTSSSISNDNDFTKFTRPDWGHPRVYNRFGKNVIEMPVDSMTKFASGLRNSVTNNPMQT